ncbi:ATP-binding protein [Streptomyces europaeiscabiei]|uniref:ATP-binding protein n=1 Tax=Streptomyces europaeiscabiei TaxID=146819 RepID=UPI0030DFEFB6
MHSLTVQVDGDHLARLVRSPRAGLTELIWNALDADADVVDGRLEFSTLGAVERVLVVDRGHGMSSDDVQQGFGALGGSWKRSTRTTRQQGRRLHGEQGKGRFAAFGIGDVVEWCTVHEGDPATEMRIRAARHNLRRFDITTAPAEAGIGTRVSVVSVNEAAGKQLEQDSLIDTLSAEFAIYLESYPHVEISWRGQKLNPAALQVEREEYGLDVDGMEGQPQLVVIEWRRQVDRALYLCDEAGMALHDIKPGIQAPGFDFTAYLKWGGFRGHDVLLAESGLEPMNSVVVAAKEKLREHFKRRSADRRRSIIRDWVSEGSYPYSDGSSSAAENAERQVFDIVAFTASKVINDGDFRSRKLTLRLLREALASNPGNLHNVLRGVLELSAERLAELSELLNRTTLASIISTSKKIGDRLSFLTGLDTILFDADPRRETLERRQLHRILANETWVFGEEYALTGDDESLTKVLAKYLHLLGEDVGLAGHTKPVLRHDGTNPIPDLVLTRTCEIAQDRVENIVVELKRPSQEIGADELMQIEKYALAVMRDERFNKPNVSWDFWIIGNSLDEFAESRRNQTGLPFGYIQRTDRHRVQVRTWSEVINDARHRLKFVERSLDYRATHDDGVEYLRSKHAQFLPPSLGEGPAQSPSSEGDQGSSDGDVTDLAQQASDSDELAERSGRELSGER